MTFSAVLAALYRAGVTYWQTPAGTLGYRAPQGLPSELRTAMREHKADLLFLTCGGVKIDGQGQEPTEDYSTGAARAA